MRKCVLVVLMALSASAVAGNCDSYYGTAADGSSCGLRSHDSRVAPDSAASPVDNDLTPIATDRLIPTSTGDSVLEAGENTYPDDVEFACNGDLNLTFNAGRYVSSVEKSEVPENWYSVGLVAHNHNLGEQNHIIYPNGADAQKVTYNFDANDTGYLTIADFPHVWEFATLKVNYVKGKAVSASLVGNGDFNYQCKRINVDNPWKA
ncbi:hypothetical protein L8O47_10725 [Enterobacter roggenkampii]|uniref:hypothetical protein n=1 Tax=Enterobacter roggenkampii TaxID=1812935 RepID=UPI002002BABB|nr:hypothetical protein [Enterobacter roggenkampii]MCK7151381.1 hypothetical protein [Enterobacter roggenkampii]